MSLLQQFLAATTALAVMAAVAVTDPTGDAVGDGTLVAPTAPRYANSAIFDLQDVRAEDLGRAAGAGTIVLVPEQDGVAADGTVSLPPLDTARSRLRVTLGAIAGSESAPLGFTSVVVDVYLDTAPGGMEVTLDGPGMLLPGGSGWEFAVRVSPDGASGFAYLGAGSREDAAVESGTDDGRSPGAASEAGGGAGTAAAAAAGAAGPQVAEVPVGFTLDGTTMVIDLPWSLPAETVPYAASGVHDPFNPTGWRPLADRPSPWAYSGGEQVTPVIDLLAPTFDDQVRALRTGVLARPRTPSRAAGALWLVLMALGVAVAGFGLWLRRYGPARSEATPRMSAPSATRSAALAGSRSSARPAPGGGLRTGLPPEPVPTHAPRHGMPVSTRGETPVWQDVAVSVDAVPTELGAGRPGPNLADAAAKPESALASGSAATSEPAAGTVAGATARTAASEEPAAHPPDTLTGASAFDAYVLFERSAEDDDDELAESFDERA